MRVFVIGLSPVMGSGGTLFLTYWHEIYVIKNKISNMACTGIFLLGFSYPFLPYGTVFLHTAPLLSKLGKPNLWENLCQQSFDISITHWPIQVLLFTPIFKL